MSTSKTTKDIRSAFITALIGESESDDESGSNMITEDQAENIADSLHPDGGDERTDTFESICYLTFSDIKDIKNVIIEASLERLRGGWGSKLDEEAVKKALAKYVL